MSQGLVSFKELFDFSRRSEDSANVVRELTASLEPRAQISASESENAFEILLTRPKHSSSFTTILKIIPPTSEKAQKIREKNPEAIETILINNVEFVFYLETEAYRGYDVIVSEDLKKDGMMLLEHLKDIFSAELVEIAPGESSLVSNASTKLSVKEGKVSHAEMNRFLGDELEKKILFCAPEPPEFTHPYPILGDKLVILNSQWFTRQNLLSLDCSRITLGRSTLTSEDLNEFIKRWVHSDCKKFKQLIVSEALSEHRILDWVVIASGLEWVPTCEKNELLRYGTPKKMNYALDVKRDDGLVATVIIGESECGNEVFLFEVQKPKTEEGDRYVYPRDSDDGEGFAFSEMLRNSTKTHAEMRNLLENGDSKQTNIHQVPEEGFVYDKPISTRSFTLHHSTWFTRQNLLNLDCVNVAFLNSNRLTNEDINAFISQWYHSDNKKLETLSIYGIGSYREAPFKPDLAVITAGVPTVPAKNRETNQMPLTKKKKYEKGLDIIRSDGLEANVLLQDVGYKDTQQLFFTVFHPATKAIDNDAYQKAMLEAFAQVGLAGFDFS